MTDLAKLRFSLAIFLIGLILSGVTAMPLRSELPLAIDACARLGFAPDSGLMHWLNRVDQAVEYTGREYPFLAYGDDWLAFGHLTMALAFVGAWLDPVRNRWLFTFGLLSCAAVIPFAMIAGHFRGIPFYWRLIDCSFGVFGMIPLLVCLRYLKRLEVR